jgi:ATP-binding protein involved in chromosome partitioning
MQNIFNRVRTTAKHRLMVISAKGGVGKSTVTVNLAAALAARRLKVGIFDADIHGPNIPALLGIRQGRNLRMGANPEAMMPVVVHPDSLDMRPIPPFERYGLKVMSLALLVGEGQMLNPEPELLGGVIRVMLARVDWGGADIVLVDMPPGTGEPLHTIINEQSVDAALIVAVRERLAHLDNGRLLGYLRNVRLPILGVVENMTHVICPNCGERIDLYPAPAAEESVYRDAPVVASIPFHPELIRQVRGGAPLPLAEPDAPAAAPLLALADYVIRSMQITTS